MRIKRFFLIAISLRFPTLASLYSMYLIVRLFLDFVTSLMPPFLPRNCHTLVECSYLLRCKRWLQNGYASFLSSLSKRSSLKFAVPATSGLSYEDTHHSVQAAYHFSIVLLERCCCSVLSIHNIFLSYWLRKYRDIFLYIIEWEQQYQKLIASFLAVPTKANFNFLDCRPSVLSQIFAFSFRAKRVLISSCCPIDCSLVKHGSGFKHITLATLHLRPDFETVFENTEIIINSFVIVILFQKCFSISEIIKSLFWNDAWTVTTQHWKASCVLLW